MRGKRQNRQTPLVDAQEEQLRTQAILIEMLLSGFFAIACFRARAMGANRALPTPRTLFRLTDRLERLRRSRWQWFAMVLLLVVVRMQSGAPMVAELTVLAQFAIFLALPAQKAVPEVA